MYTEHVVGSIDGETRKRPKREQINTSNILDLQEYRDPTTFGSLSEEGYVHISAIISDYINFYIR